MGQGHCHRSSPGLTWARSIRSVARGTSSRRATSVVSIRRRINSNCGCAARPVSASVIIAPTTRTLWKGHVALLIRIGSSSAILRGRVGVKSEKRLKGVSLMGRHRKSHCVNGHALTDDNTTREPSGWGRICLECRRAKDRARYRDNPERRRQVLARAHDFNRRNYSNVWSLPPASQWLSPGAMQ